MFPKTVCVFCDGPDEFLHRFSGPAGGSLHCPTANGKACPWKPLSCEKLYRRHLLYRIAALFTIHSNELSTTGRLNL